LANKSWLGARILVVSPTPSHPQDHGNRKRVFEICAELKRQGAYIHFVHYASEHEWRHGRPALPEKQMRAAWDAYDLIAPSRELHLAAASRDHTIDEWADPGLSAFVAWICRIDKFDAVIVNYTWLSFCLDAVPAAIFKILDTHDAFGNRRAMLAKIGIEPEFFHTTPEEEAKALARADLVWAIKDDERDYFIRDLGMKNCLTMLHAEPATGVWQGAPSKDPFLRAGVIGARNNVNRQNLEGFLDIALPLFNHYLADVKIVIAGGCSDDFQHRRHPNVEILGRVSDVAEFYRGVDVVIAPVAASTGLKIKVSEAVASGAPLVALAHATEGYPTQEPLHLLYDFKAMAMALIELAFTRERLTDLAARSHQVWLAIESQVLTAIEQTRQQIIARERRHICVVAPIAALNPASLLYDQLFAALTFIGRTNPTLLFLTGPAASPNSAIFDHFGSDLRVFAEPALIAALADQTPDTWTPIELTALFENRGFERAYLIADCRKTLAGGTGLLQRAYVRHDAIAIAGGDADALVEFLRPTVPTLLLSADQRSIGKWAGQYGIADSALVPFRQTDPFVSFAAPDSDKTIVRPILILAAADDPLLPALREYAAALSAGVSVLDPADPVLSAALTYPAAGPDDPRPLIAGAKLVIDLGRIHPLAAVLREAARRLGIPVITPVRGPRAAARAHSSPETSPTSLLRLLRVIALLLADGATAARHAEATKLYAMAETADAGWFWLWRDLTGVVTQATAPEELFGIK